jgi:hypothetical protein
MFNLEALTFQEFAMREPLPLATLQSAILDFLRGRDDVVLFGAQAVNAYVSEPRMTQDIDVMSTQAEAFAQALQTHLNQKFHIALRVRTVAGGRGYRLFQVQKTGNRHLVDIRPVDHLPSAQRIAEVLVMTPATLIASKVMAYHGRRGKPKAGTDWRDIAMLLITFPDFQVDPSAVATCLQLAGADAIILQLWQDLAAQPMQLEDEDDEF